MKRTGVFRGALILACACVLCDYALAQRGALTRPLNLAQITQQSAEIVRGRIVATRVESHPQYKHLNSVVVTVRVSESLKGSPGETLTFRQFIWDVRDRLNAAGYRRGEEVVLFLNKPSEVGFSSPVGIQQGRFRVMKDETGETVAVNGHNNVNLMEGVAQMSVTSRLSARSRKAIQRQQEKKAGALPLDVLEETVRGLVEAQRSNQ